jgi:hypothetical protein
LAQENETMHNGGAVRAAERRFRREFQLRWLRHELPGQLIIGAAVIAFGTMPFWLGWLLGYGLW